MDKKIKVVMLPTDEKANGENIIVKQYSELGLAFGYNITNVHNLYFLSDEEIKEGDLFIYLKDKVIHKAHFNSTKAFSHCKDGDYIIAYENNLCKKVIASTDKSLELPQPSEEFLESYVKAYNEGKQITEVMVEYHEGYWKDLDSKEDDWIESYPMVNSDNTISIRKIKDSWNRDELISNLYSLANYIGKDQCMSFMDYVDKWIKENL